MAQDSLLVDQLVPPRRAAQRAMVKVKEQQHSRSSKHDVVSSAFGRADSPLSQEESEQSSPTDDAQSSRKANGHAVSKSAKDHTKATRPRSATTSKTIRRVKSQGALSTRGAPATSSQPLPPLSPLSETSEEPLLRQTPKRKIPKQSPPPQRKRAKLESAPSQSRIQDLLAPGDTGNFITCEPSKWSRDKLGEFVYVRLGREGSVTPAGETHFKPPGYWWPAKSIDKAAEGLNLLLYGDDGFGPSREIIIDQPSHNCVNSFTNVNSNASFIQGDFAGDIEPRLLKNPYRHAREMMLGDIGFQRVLSPMDEVPPRNQLTSVGRLVPTASLGKKSKSEDPRDLETDPDGTLQIPGELVLAREPKGKHAVYWPARILEFSPKDPESDKDFPGYIAQYFPGPELPQKIRRSHFATTIDLDFVTCKVGEWRTDLAENHQPRDENATSRSPTPEADGNADLGPPPSPEGYRDLTIKEQLQFAQPVLNLIIQGRYVPAVEDHLGFLGGGDGRKKVISMAAQDGGFSKGEIDNIRYEVLRWALRDERRGEHLLDESEEQPEQPAGERAPDSNDLSGQETSDALARGANEDPHVLHKHPPRPRGDGIYEQLSHAERIQYCTDFLCRQALIQLLMWRNDLRRTTMQRAPDDEAAAYIKASDKLAEGHWWDDVLNRRREFEKAKRARDQVIPGDLDRSARAARRR